MIPLRHMSIDARLPEIYTLKPPKDNEKIPVVGLNPIHELLDVLRVFNIILHIDFSFYFTHFILFQVSYSEYALFFHDTYGGDVIGVVFKPHAFNSTDFKVSYS